MASIEKFQDLEAWKKGREITKKIYEISSNDRFSKDFALCNQIRRASISITSNIAEGFGRDGDKEFVQFLSVAKASCFEVYSQLYVAIDQNYIDEKEFKEISESIEETTRIIGGLMKYLQQSTLKGSKFR
jgi:four helix bundle protein